MRWTVAGTEHSEDQAYPWSYSVTAHSGDAVSLRACSDECGSEHNVTVTTTITWKGTRLTTLSKTGKTKEGHCQPSATVTATLP